jgi:hypothetical protein
MNEHDPIADALASRATPPLDPRLAARVAARAKLELHPAARARANDRLGLMVARGLVPALLALAALVQVAGTIGLVSRIYAKEPTASSP